jgi:hypothetical protein
MAQGLYSNIHAKRKPIEQGSGERMRKPGEEGAPTAKAFKQSEKTAARTLARTSNPGTQKLK